MTPLPCPKAFKHNPQSPADNTWLNYVDMIMRTEWWHCNECGHNWNVQFTGANSLPSLSAEEPSSAERGAG